MPDENHPDRSRVQKGTHANPATVRAEYLPAQLTKPRRFLGFEAIPLCSAAV